MRNLAAKTALEIEAEFLLFVDDDVLVPHDGLCKLLEACEVGADVAAGKAVIRGYPFDWMVFTKFDEETGKGLETYKELPKEGVIEVGATGFCFTLIRTELFKKMRPPFFLTALNHTEDIWFYRKALEANPGAKFVVDCSVDCGHILWPEVMNSENREHYREYMEKCNPGLKPENMVGYMEGRKQRDRALDYADKVKEAVGSLTPEVSDTPNRCCDNGNFGELHDCQKQNGSAL